MPRPDKKSKLPSQILEFTEAELESIYFVENLWLGTWLNREKQKITHGIIFLFLLIYIFYNTKQHLFI